MADRFHGPVTSRFLISMPRSGHHMVERIISHVFSLQGYDYSYCEFYNCCKTSPCRYNKLLQKHHDDQLEFSRNEGRYVALFRRDIIRQIDALYRYRIGKKRGEYNNLIDQDSAWWQSEEYIIGLIRLIRRNTAHHSGFISKWASAENEHILAVEYYEFLADPLRHAQQILAQLFEGLLFGDAQIERAIEIEQPRLINQIPDSVYAEIRSRLRGQGLKIV